MSGFLGSILWRGISEYLLIHNDLKRFRGRKNVIAALAPDRTHPEFVKIEDYFADFKEDDDWVYVKEDHPRGAMHKTLECGDQEFCAVVVDKKGRVRRRSPVALSFREAKDSLQSDGA